MRGNNPLVLRVSLDEFVNGQLFPFISALRGGVMGKLVFILIF